MHKQVHFEILKRLTIINHGVQWNDAVEETALSNHTDDFYHL
jgi:hypothetical protein